MSVRLLPGLVALMSSTTIAAALAEEVSVSSPDGRTEITVTDEGGIPRYQVARDGDIIISASRLGMRFKAGGNLDEGFEITSSARDSADETWEQPWGESRLVTDRHEELLVSFEDEDGANFDVRFRAFDEGLGFRYEVPGKGTRVLIDELTEFRVEPDAMTWWTPAGAFNRYEYIYRTTPLRQMERAHTPLTLRLADGTHLAIHEAALVNYGGAWLDQRRDGVLEIEVAPRYDGTKVVTEGDFVTPWRTVQIADNAAGLVNGAVMTLNLNEPNALGDVSYVTPMKYIGIWWGMHIGTQTWGSGEKHGATTENTKAYMDFAATHGFGGVLVEGWNIGWDGDWFNNGDLFRFAESYPDFDIEEVTAYGKKLGVQLIGHNETSANITNYENQINEAFALYERLGMHAIKTGYVADASDLKYIGPDGEPRYTWHDSQESVDHHIRVLKKAHEHKLMINAHEPVKDTGLRRTYPNAVSREGARGMEFNAWGTPPNPPEHEAILPYTRLLAGPMDFTPGVFDLMPNGEGAENRINTTLAKQLALYVVIHSPVQMAADLPENYAPHMDAFRFIEDVPADWEQSIALDGEVGDFIVMARQGRGTDNWYVGVLTDEDARTVKVPLSFLEDGVMYRAKIYKDGRRANYLSRPYDISISEEEVTASDTLTFRLGKSGGAAISLEPVETGTEE
ncbi:glycoside hydrolase family 97 protein [Parvularcula marina]|uniref:Glycoside hydrolase family 97 protein n=1 Tax=Parvularcula marina TaxID=2292771 RepID=A0A371RKZ3_9PROT|nr:glycoside hydrolase family 97 protein [Parvularcula marina]RFB06128.1 glycoside hydrolase family 97 protein [Parvularcula marina]